MKIYEPCGGEHLRDVAAEMIALAVQSGETVVTEFHTSSGLVLVARPDTTVDEIEKQFDSKGSGR